MLLWGNNGASNQPLIWKVHEAGSDVKAGLIKAFDPGLPMI